MPITRRFYQGVCGRELVEESVVAGVLTEHPAAPGVDLLRDPGQVSRGEAG